MNYPKSLLDLIEDFAKLPSIGKKTAERLALYVYAKMSEEDLINFSNDILKVKTSIRKCKICGNITEDDTCSICLDESRNKRLVMVVENIKDLYVIEQIKEYKGNYHVLNGAISFRNGISVEDLDIESLYKKVKNKEIDELILACNATLEGETTAKYLKALFENDEIKITRLASGLPVGGDIQYADEMTVLRALEGRRVY